MMVARNIFYVALSSIFLLTTTSAADVATPVAPITIPVELTNPVALGLTPGTWREYRLTGGPTDGATLRWTWLETENHDGQSYQWFETRLTSPGKRLVTKLLANPARLTEAPRVVIMKMNDNPAQSMPGQLRQKSLELLNYAGQTPAESVTEETIDVVAGTFKTSRYNVQANGITQKTYISESLPGIILTEAEGFRMELIALGSDGEAAIKEVGASSQQPPAAQRGPNE